MGDEMELKKSVKYWKNKCNRLEKLCSKYERAIELMVYTLKTKDGGA